MNQLKKHLTLPDFKNIFYIQRYQTVGVRICILPVNGVIFIDKYVCHDKSLTEVEVHYVGTARDEAVKNQVRGNRVEFVAFAISEVLDKLAIIEVYDITRLCLHFSLIICRCLTIAHKNLPYLIKSINCEKLPSISL